MLDYVQLGFLVLLVYFVEHCTGILRTKFTFNFVSKLCFVCFHFVVFSMLPIYCALLVAKLLYFLYYQCVVFLTLPAVCVMFV